MLLVPIVQRVVITGINEVKIATVLSNNEDNSNKAW